MVMPRAHTDGTPEDPSSQPLLRRLFDLHLGLPQLIQSMGLSNHAGMAQSCWEKGTTPDMKNGCMHRWCVQHGKTCDGPCSPVWSTFASTHPAKCTSRPCRCC